MGPTEALAWYQNERPSPVCDWMDADLADESMQDQNDIRQSLISHGTGPLTSDCATIHAWCQGSQRYEGQGFSSAGTAWEDVCRLADRCDTLANRLEVFRDGLEAEGQRAVRVEQEDEELARAWYFDHLEQMAPRWWFLVNQFLQTQERLYHARCEATIVYFQAITHSAHAMLSSHANYRPHMLRVMGSAPANGADAVRQLEPPSQAYDRLVEARIHYARVEEEGGFVKLSRKAARLTKRSRGNLVQQLRKRLKQEGLLEPGDEKESDRFDSAMVQALRDFQFMHYLRVRGRMNRDTQRAMEISAKEKRTRIDRALLVIRKAIPPWEADFLHVQTPHAFLEVYFSGQFVRLFRTVIGSARRGHLRSDGRRRFLFRTLPIRSKIDRVVLNPEWKVPDSIAEREIIPAMLEDPTYLEKHNYRVKTYSGGKELYIQEAGPGNALGLVKFLFRNSYGYYLHDTPSKRLFKRRVRLFSHGCVRVQHALELAELVLKHDRNLDRSWIRRVLRKKKPSSVLLHNPLPIIVTYHTAGADAHGRLFFAKDYYEMEQ